MNAELFDSAYRKRFETLSTTNLSDAMDQVGINIEFFQIGPAVFNAPLTFIIHSHMWRLRPRLTNVRGEEFLPRYCPAGIDPAEVLDLKAGFPGSVNRYTQESEFMESLQKTATGRAL